MITFTNDQVGVLEQIAAADEPLALHPLAAAYAFQLKTAGLVEIWFSWTNVGDGVTEVWQLTERGKLFVAGMAQARLTDHNRARNAALAEARKG